MPVKTFVDKFMVGWKATIEGRWRFHKDPECTDERIETLTHKTLADS